MKRNIIIIILTLLVLGLVGYIVYDKVLLKENNSNVDNNFVNTNNNNTQNSNGKIYIKRDGVISLEAVPTNIVGKYVNKVDKNDYFILNSDGTAIVSFPTGGRGYVAINDQVTFQLTYHPNSLSYSDEVTVELYNKSGINPFSPMRIGMKDSNGNYKFTVTEPTPTANVGSYDFIKEQD